ncbi:hypothetical protein Tco_0024215 [Tanacetum coccineum]
MIDQTDEVSSKISESHSGLLSSMKSLEDTENFGDQFLYDKPTEDDQEKSKVKRSSDSSKKLKGIQTLTPAKQEAADIMKALKESKKRRDSLELEVSMKELLFPDEEMLILEWGKPIWDIFFCEHFDKDDNEMGHDNEN